jgi:hypothetical protein
VALFALLGAVFTFLAAGLGRTQWSVRRLSEMNWDDLLTELKPIETDGITAAVAERMRRDAMALRRAVIGIGLGMSCGYGKRRVPSYIREAAGVYYLMRQRVLAIYRASHSGLYSNLANAV